MKLSNLKQVNAQGLGFLLGYSALAALLNYLTTIQPTSASQETRPWILGIGWALIVLFYLPIYGAFIYSIRKWNWSLDEWGFGLKGRNWLSIGLALLALLFVWLPLPPIELGSLRIGDLGILREMFAQAGFSMQLFGGYARVAEELLFRGFALILFRRIFSHSRHSWLWAILLSSALFALVHTHRVTQMIQLFLGAAIPLAAFTLWTRSISTAFILHAIAGGGPVGGLLAVIFFFGPAFYNDRKKQDRSSKTGLEGIGSEPADE